MVDRRRVRRLLDRLADDIGHLWRWEAVDRTAVLADETALDAIKYRFITALQGVMQIAQHLCASEGWGPPGNNAEAVELLGRHGVLDTGLSSRMGHAVGFRNLLVHRYADVDDARVVANLSHLEDLQDFSRQVANWVLGQADEGDSTPS